MNGPAMIDPLLIRVYGDITSFFILCFAGTGLIIILPVSFFCFLCLRQVDHCLALRRRLWGFSWHVKMEFLPLPHLSLLWTTRRDLLILLLVGPCYFQTPWADSSGSMAFCTIR